jgi:hypothetical protein
MLCALPHPIEISRKVAGFTTRAITVAILTCAQAFTASAECDPNYDPCVPIASDVDCAGGRGNGPEYVRGPVRVIGRDIYGLDRDNDGIGCENC